jgi:hypothetical protein
MMRRYEGAILEVRVSFEVTRISRECLVEAYERLLSVVQRRCRSAEEGGVVSTAPGARRAWR